MKIQVRVVRLGPVDYQAQAYLAGWGVVGRGRDEAEAIQHLVARIETNRRASERIVEVEIPDDVQPSHWPGSQADGAHRG